MYLSQMPDKYHTFTGPTPAISETDIAKNLRVKVEAIKDLHQFLDNDKCG